MRVSDIMSTALVSLHPQQTLREASALLSERHLSGAPVVDGGRVVGILSISDIVDFIAANRTVTLEPPMQDESVLDEQERELPFDFDGTLMQELATTAPEGFAELVEEDGADVIDAFHSLAGNSSDLLDRHPVEAVMTRNVIGVQCDADIVEAARFMLWGGVHRVLVMDGSEMVGIVSAMDVVQAVAQGSRHAA